MTPHRVDQTLPPRRPRRRIVVALGIVISAPLALVAAGSGQAAPTLTIPQAEAQISALQAQEDQAVEAYDAGTIAATAAQQKAGAAQVAVHQAGSRLAVLDAGMRGFAVETYTTGGIDPISAFLAAGDPQVLLDRAGALNEISRSQQRQVAAVHAQRVVLDTAQATAAQRSAQATQALTVLSTNKNRIEGLIAQQQAVLSHLQAQQRAALLAAQQKAAAAAAAQAHAALVAQQQAATHQAAVAHAAAVAAAARRATTHTTPTRTTTHQPASPPRSSPAPAPAPAPPVQTGGGSSNAGLVALAAAETQMGKPYQWAAAGPDAYDCSGLVEWAFARAGISLPHSAAAQYGYGTHVSLSSLQPGDLVFFDSPIGHVGIYVGNGEMIDANHSGGWVGIRPLYSGLVGATRI